MWGRKTTDGYTEVRFAGVDADGTILLRRKDVAIHTNETTVSRAGFMPVPTSSTTSTYGQVGSTPISSTSTAAGTAYVPTRSATSVVMPADTLEIRLPRGQKRVRVSGYELQVREATAVDLSYKLEVAP